jgi:hypothetical protein
MSERLRRVLKAVTDDPDVLRQLREDPQALASRFDLSDDERQRLQRSDLLITFVDQLQGGTQTTTPITITVTVA